MKTKEFVFRGWVPAAAVVIDERLLGERQAIERVLELYRPGTAIHQVADGPWLVIFPEPREMNTREAPGLALVRRRGRLIGSPDLEGGSQPLTYRSAGAVRHVDDEGLRSIDPSAWLDIDDLVVVELSPMVVPARIDALDPPEPARVDLRRIAHVAARSARSLAVADQLAGVQPRASSVGSAGRGLSDLSSAFWSFLSGLLLRSPLKGEIGRQHARYLEQLSQAFNSGDLDEALRNALPLGGLAGKAMTLRLPRRRLDLRIRPGGSRARAHLPLGPSVYVYLQTMYRQAAERLESAGRIEEAAFVYAELLNNPMECIGLLERHQRFELAATIAEDRKLDGALIVRLWWLAGDRTRAVVLARRYNAFAAVIERLTESDPSQASQLRVEWASALEQAGDLLGAVEAGWPDHQVRPFLAGAVERRFQLGGPAGAALHAYALELDPSDATVAGVRTLIASFDEPDVASLRSFMLALARTRGEPSADREICSAAMRAAARIGRHTTDKAFTTAYRAIRARADPILAADLPSADASRRSPETIECPPELPGLVRIWDAAILPDDSTLLALGEGGCRLLGADGRVAARWDVPTHRLVVADHGGSALLLTVRDEVDDVHILDMARRSTRQYGAIRCTQWADSFDGSVWATVDTRGIAFLDMLATKPTVVWRELEAGWTCHRLARSAGSLAAVIGIPAQGASGARVELWRWQVPTMRLQRRQAIAPVVGATRFALLSDGTSNWISDGRLVRIVGIAPANERTVEIEMDDLFVSQDLVAIRRPETDDATHATSEVTVHIGFEPEDLELRAHLGVGGLGFRASGRRVALWDGTGRLVTADLAASRLITTHRLVT